MFCELENAATAQATATATATGAQLDIEIDKLLEDMSVDKEFLDDTDRNVRPKLDVQPSPLDDLIVPSAENVEQLPAPSKPPEWSRMADLATQACFFAKTKLLPTSRNSNDARALEALMRSKYATYENDRWRNVVDCTICYYNAFALPPQHEMADKYVDIAMMQWKRLIDAHGYAGVQEEIDDMRRCHSDDEIDQMMWD